MVSSMEDGGGVVVDGGAAGVAEMELGSWESAISDAGAAEE